MDLTLLDLLRRPGVFEDKGLELVWDKLDALDASSVESVLRFGLERYVAERQDFFLMKSLAMKINAHIDAVLPEDLKDRFKWVRMVLKEIISEDLRRALIVSVLWSLKKHNSILFGDYCGRIDSAVNDLRGKKCKNF